MSWFEVKSPKRGAKLRLDASFFVIGRGERIPIFHDDPSISREHAAVVIKKAGVRVRDLGSKNGVLLNGQPIGRYAEVDVKPGDSLKVGATTLVLHEGEPPVQTKPEATVAMERATSDQVAPVRPDPEPAAPAPAPSADAPAEDLSKLEAREELPPVPTSSDEVDDAESPDSEKTMELE